MAYGRFLGGVTPSGVVMAAILFVREYSKAIFRTIF